MKCGETQYNVLKEAIQSIFRGIYLPVQFCSHGRGQCTGILFPNLSKVVYFFISEIAIKVLIKKYIC